MYIIIYMINIYIVGDGDDDGDDDDVSLVL